LSLLSTRQLAELQNIAADVVCDLPCTIKRSMVVENAYGTGSETIAIIAETMAGMVAPTAGQIAQYADKLGTLTTWLVRLPYGTGVRRLDTLVIAGRSLIVQALLSPLSYPALTSVLATEV
jgi:hypothetical protein